MITVTEHPTAPVLTRFDKVIAMNPPSPTGYVSNKDSMGGFGQLFPVGATLFPPLDLVYFASYLVDRNISVVVQDCLGLELTKEELIQNLASDYGNEGDTAILLIVRTSAPTLDWDLSVCREIKAKIPKIEIGIYGPVVLHVIARIQKEEYIDYIIPTDPDEVVYELVTNHAKVEIFGLIYRSQNEWCRNVDRPLIKDLDSLPFPKWELFPFQKYQLPKSSTKSGLSDVFLPMLTSRGCPIGCNYCPYPVGQGLAWRHRSAENVVDEIEHLVKDLNVKYILFRDPIFSLNQNRVIKICQEIIDRGLQFEWRCETRVDCLTQDTLKMMAKSGCSGINFGIESADIQIQINVGRKPISQEQFVQMISTCRELGIKTFSFFIVGLPGDTVQSILRTIKFAIDLQPNWVQFTAASPFIGTKLRDWAIAQGFVTEDEYAYISSHEVAIGNENLSKEQIQSLLWFAKLIGNYLINRKGILKDDSRLDWFYKTMKVTADRASKQIAQILFVVGQTYFEKRFKSTT
ncbi:radical SAM protein (plasmid) [Pseudanabaena biceps]|nr:radical SAM protein [Pseudanabaena biceps]